MSEPSSTARRRPRPSPGRRRIRALPIAALCLIGAIYLADSAAESARLDRQEPPAGLGEPGFVAPEEPGAPNVIRARLLVAYALVAAGDHAAAARAFEQAVRREPRNWLVTRDLAVELARSGDLRGAGEALERARELNPRLAIPNGFVF